MYSLPGLQLDNVSFPDLSTTSVVNLSGETNFIASAAKAEATVRRKAKKREISLDGERQCFGPGKIGYGKMKNSLISRTCIMKPKDFLRSVILIVVYLPLAFRRV